MNVYEKAYNALNELLDELSEGKVLSEQEQIYLDNISELVSDYEQMWKRHYVSPDPCGYVEIALDGQTANLCHHSGSCDDGVKEGLQIPYVRQQLDELTDEQIDKSIDAIFGESNGTREDKESRLLWLAAAEVVENY